MARRRETYAQAQRRRHREEGLAMDPRPRFKEGDEVQIMDGRKVLARGTVSWVGPYDDYLKQHRYKVQTATSRLTYNENSLRKIKKPARKKKRASQQATLSAALKKDR